MNHQDHLHLLQKGIPEPGGIWADLGSGHGAFTLALAELLGPTGEIYSIDTNRRALKRQQRHLQDRFPEIMIHYQVADFTERLALPPLDGLVMANSLHFIRRKDDVVSLVRSYLRPGGRLVVVEYNADRGNKWVPYPLSYATWQELAPKHGFTHTELLATRSSSFLGEIYAAVSW